MIVCAYGNEDGLACAVELPSWELDLMTAVDRELGTTRGWMAS